MADITIHNATSKSLRANITPMPLWQALLYFGLPALLFRISLYIGTPMLIRLGLPAFEANVVSFTLPAAILFGLAFAFYPWQMVALLPICLTVPYIAQRRQNAWPAIIIHWQNGIVLFVILAMVVAIA